MRNSALRLAAALAVLSIVDSFTISSPSISHGSDIARSATKLHSTIGAGGGGGVTSGLISNLAEMALRLRLSDQTGIKCDVSASSSDLLLRGRVGPVTVKGRGWQSALGLTCRAIEATVDSCELDVGRILSNRKLRLTTPAIGQAMIALNSVDFANFITHPLMKPPVLKSGNSQPLQFLKDDVTVDAESGSVIFFAFYMDNRWKLTLSKEKGEERATVTATPEGVPETKDLQATSAELSHAMSNFFNEMVFELDGTFLTFQDMMLTAKGSVPSVMLQLKIKVHKFPAAGLEF